MIKRWSRTSPSCLSPEVACSSTCPRARSDLIAKHRYDTIVAINVIEHIADDQALVAHLSELLKPGGGLLIYVPACPVRSDRQAPLRHHRGDQRDRAYRR